MEEEPMVSCASAANAAPKDRVPAKGLAAGAPAPVTLPTSSDRAQSRARRAPAATPGYLVDPGYELSPVERMFCELVEIDSPSFHEHEMADEVRNRLGALGFVVTEDATSGRNDGVVTAITSTRRYENISHGVAFDLHRLVHTGSDCGNLFATLPGTGVLAGADPILFITHMDTVQPANGKHAHVHADGTITSMGDTVLGADDLAGIACVMAAVERLQQQGVAHRPVELACMVAEEVGNVGARAFDFSQCKATMAYTLDYSADPHEYAYQAPTILYLTIEVIGRSAHAGFYPEKGINAIKIAAQAIGATQCGRIGDDTTVNIGLISGGRGTNIVPSDVVIRGEVRSYNHEKAVAQAQHVTELFQQAADDFGGRVTVQVSEACHAYCMEQDAPVVRRFERACEALGMQASGAPTFGGSDNNVAVAYGIPGIVMANGMRDAHSTHEHVLPGDLAKVQALVEQLLTLD
ncbi:MAG: M20/M25/M40 family metallo-hydrolase [Coriobacteriia bacterium]|nr:M20/M25/M40 family metallo-hydrolase [Coriobacteriia bacterium]MBS5477628.1 M20/M25/M40 family metallo-hydrolase [Coriobacteriia bacterium]